MVRPKELVASTQHFVLNLINSKYMHDYELLNLDMLNNAVAALKQFDAVYYEVSDDSGKWQRGLGYYDENATYFTDRNSCKHPQGFKFYRIVKRSKLQLNCSGTVV